jgi:NAD(P)-dependent dehydrogenase (short-subunit alcohol dehydrogenase family)
MNKTDLEWRNMAANPDQLKGKKILVTGAADGIGRAITIALARVGVTVIMLDHKARHLEKLYDQIITQEAAEPVILPIDLQTLTPESATALAQNIYDEFGGLDALLHNAAELGSPSPLDQYDMKYWDKVMSINFQAPYLLTRALLPVLRLVPSAQVIFTTANCAVEPQAYWGAYAIAYAAVEAQMTIWSEELERTSKISVNSLDPGAVRTSLRRRSHPGEDQNSLTLPQDIAPAYLHLLSGDHTLRGQHIRLI